MEFTARQIAQVINGEIIGNENVTVNSFSKIEEGKPGSISFLANPKYTHYIYNTKASIVLIDKNAILEKPVETTLIKVNNAYECIAKLLQMYEATKPKKTGIDPLAFVSTNAKIGKNCYIGAFAYVGDNVSIGDNTQIYPHTTICENTTIGESCTLYPNVTVYHGSVIGDRVILHAGSVIGSDGFGFAPSTNGYDKIPQIGVVTIENDVEIGANTCIDRSTMGSTYIRKGVKLDNLVQIAHNTDIGENTVMSAQVGVAGSTKVGQWCMFGGQVGLAGHIVIGNKVFLGAQSGVPGNIKDGQQLIGTPPMRQRPYFKSQAVFRRLPELYKQINDLQKQVEELQKQIKP
ncbi:UDP-3-O-(3-hydroxymyristoyl)glucosamine N-acyltransferase [Hoylesella saccharolytica]|uniref:UDP-3-O-(3-hydroxymyristoyl)glucosamine N-acyltransferase n=1 Tax=Hoylesella saccharolytica TaxID=633701 RepID=UPI00046E6A6E|nr:UDP-3-O-(3-hydroxymyristoyl)glucosamine N-acyltransferase [Hoylesella saccharolytica]